MSDARPPLDPLVVPALPKAEVAARIRARIAEAPAPRAPFRRRLALAFIAVPLAILTGLVGSCIALPGRHLLRVDIWQIPRADFAERLLLLVLLASLTTGIALLPGRRSLGSKVALLAIAAVALAPLYTLVTHVAPVGTSVGDEAARALHPLGLPCASVAFAVGTIALIAFGLALRRAVPAAPVNRAAALGAAAGGWAGVALFLQCPAKDELHLLVGHSLPVAAFALLGALVLPRVLRP